MHAGGRKVGGEAVLVFVSVLDANRPDVELIAAPGTPPARA